MMEPMAVPAPAGEHGQGEAEADNDGPRERKYSFVSPFFESSWNSTLQATVRFLDLCRSYQAPGHKCSRGENCWFVHAVITDKMRPLTAVPEKWELTAGLKKLQHNAKEVCWKYLDTGQCMYESQCHFSHELADKMDLDYRRRAIWKLKPRKTRTSPSRKQSFSLNSPAFGPERDEKYKELPPPMMMSPSMRGDSLRELPPPLMMSPTLRSDRVRELPPPLLMSPTARSEKFKEFPPPLVMSPTMRSEKSKEIPPPLTMSPTLRGEGAPVTDVVAPFRQLSEGSSSSSTRSDGRLRVPRMPSQIFCKTLFQTKHAFEEVMKAVADENYASIEYLLEHYQIHNPNFSGPDGEDGMLLTAVRSGNIRMVAFLIKKVQVDPNVRSSVDNKSALEISLITFHFGITLILARAGAECNRVKDFYPLHILALHLDKARDRRMIRKLIKVLLKAGANITMNDMAASGASKNGDCELVAPLHVTCMHQLPYDARLLLRNGADPNVMSQPSRATPLIIAAMWGRYPIVKDLLAAGANPYHRDASGRSALDYVSRVPDAEVYAVSAKLLRDPSYSRGVFKTELIAAAILDRMAHLQFNAFQMAILCEELRWSRGGRRDGFLNAVERSFHAQPLFDHNLLFSIREFMGTSAEEWRKSALPPSERRPARHVNKIVEATPLVTSDTDSDGDTAGDTEAADDSVLIRDHADEIASRLLRTARP